MAKLSMSTVKSKGRETENFFVEWMKSRWGKVVERRRQKGYMDEGDISGWDGVCVEVKCSTGKTVNLAGYLRQLEVEMKNSGAVHGFVACRPDRKPNPEDWYAVLPLRDMVQYILDSDEKLIP